MTIWQGALTLLRLEGRRSWIGLVVAMAFFAYIGAIIILPLFNEMADSHGAHGYGLMTDCMYLVLTPVMGFLMKQNSFNYCARDPHTRKLAYWRTLPISWNAIVLWRMLQHVIVLTCTFTFFIALQYVFSGAMREQLAFGEYVLFALIWYGYAMAAGATYIFFEMTLRGKTYFIVCTSYLLLYGLAGLILWSTDTQLVLGAIDVSREHHYGWPILSVAIGAAGTALIGLLTRARIAKRSLLQ